MRHPDSWCLFELLPVSCSTFRLRVLHLSKGDLSPRLGALSHRSPFFAVCIPSGGLGPRRVVHSSSRAVGSWEELDEAVGWSRKDPLGIWSRSPACQPSQGDLRRSRAASAGPDWGALAGH